MLDIVSSNLNRAEDVAAILLADGYLTPKLLVRQHVGQQRRIIGRHGHEALARAVEPAVDVALFRRRLAVGDAIGLDRASAARPGVDPLLRPGIELGLQLLGILAPPRT